MNALLIDKNDLRHNINVIKNIANKNNNKKNPYTIIGVVKGNGYGLRTSQIF